MTNSNIKSLSNINSKSLSEFKSDKDFIGYKNEIFTHKTPVKLEEGCMKITYKIDLYKPFELEDVKQDINDWLSNYKWSEKVLLSFNYKNDKIILKFKSK
jgi:hypothetical protein